MLERTTRAHLEGVLPSNFICKQDNNFATLETKRSVPRRLCKSSFSSTKVDERCRSPDECIMTRKPRTRRPCIPAIQSGYCAVCNLPYNNVEDHIQSKKHQKLIGEDANFIALNGSLNGFLNTSSIPFLNLNGIDAIGVHETSLEEFSPIPKRRTMRRTRAMSVMCDRIIKPSPLSPTGSDSAGHHLRSRRYVNYMTPPLDDDSLQDKFDISIPEKQNIDIHEEPPHHEYKEYRELRSSTRALAKLTEPIPEIQDEVWNSGRPKRACIKQKRLSADEHISNNCKTFYKVEVLAPKLRITKGECDNKRQRSQSPKIGGENIRDSKGLIVKFKKLRNSELVQLNNEATNFLFPQKDNESSENETMDLEDNNTVGNYENIQLVCNDSETCNKSKLNLEDEASMDSNSSNKKRRRRTHAEAFIMDNQKYYKFETPGSRLRYHGSYLAPQVMKSPKHSPNTDSIKGEPEDKPFNVNKNVTMNIENYAFSFEKVPGNAPWYKAFQRQDQATQRYSSFSDNRLWNSFVLPYQMPTITPLNPRICMSKYTHLLKHLCEQINLPENEGISVCSTESVTSNSSLSACELEQYEDGKINGTALMTSCIEEKNRRTKALMLQQANSKNPRKSPRQHASTLAILSSFLQQRKRRSKNKSLEEEIPNLPTIVEELPPSLPEVTQEPAPEVQEPKITEVQEPKITEVQEPKTTEVPKVLPPEAQSPERKPKTPLRKIKPKIDYFSIARKIDDELDTVFDENMESYELEIAEDSTVEFHQSKVNVSEILKLYEEGKSKETDKSCRRFFNGTPGRKPGRRKKNKTGWPNKSRRRFIKRDQSKEKDNDASTIDSLSINNDSEDEICDEESTQTDSIREEACKSEQSVTEDNSCNNRIGTDCNLLTNKVTNSEFQFQPYVFVQKLDSNVTNKQSGTSRRTKRRQRHIPGSPKSPRILRKPRGRWYRER